MPKPKKKAPKPNKKHLAAYNMYVRKTMRTGGTPAPRDKWIKQQTTALKKKKKKK